MEVEAAKMIGVGLAAMGMGIAAIGVALVFSSYLTGALRNPSAASKQFGNLIFGFAMVEAFGIFSLVLAFMMLFG